jgi:sterol desaturase/sphingolipid hydroxylase (fatty acid hydroxylase superfamily)
MAAIIDASWEMLKQKLAGSMGPAAMLLLLSILISAIVVFLRSSAPRTPAGLLRFMFPREVLTHPSARADFVFWISRKFLNLLVTLPAGAAVTVAFGYGAHRVLQMVFGPVGHVETDPGIGTMVLFTASMLLAYDLSYYIYHNLQHRVPMLWELHKVHHSAEVMVGTTKDRVHPIDDIMNRVWDGMIAGTVYGVWLFFVYDPVELTILGINIYVLRNIIMMDFVRHTHLKISFGPVINDIILCPHYHQLHHSTNPRHFDRNFGLMLSMWDKMFGTLARPEPNESFSFGLSDHEHDEYQSLSGLYLLPLRKMARRLKIGRAKAPGDGFAPLAFEPNSSEKARQA